MIEIRHDLIVVFVPKDDYTKLSLFLRSSNTIYKEMYEYDEFIVLQVPISQVNSFKNVTKAAKIKCREYFRDDPKVVDVL